MMNTVKNTRRMAGVFYGIIAPIYKKGGATEKQMGKTAHGL
jgi:hypothetical protein